MHQGIKGSVAARLPCISTLGALMPSPRNHLGYERAFAVRQHLLSNGVTASRMYLASHGPDEPRTTKAASRRVEIVVLLN